MALDRCRHCRKDNHGSGYNHDDQTAAAGVITGGEGARLRHQQCDDAGKPTRLLRMHRGFGGAAFIYLWNTNEDFRQFWIDLWEENKEVAIAAWEANLPRVCPMRKSAHQADGGCRFGTGFDFFPSGFGMGLRARSQSVAGATDFRVVCGIPSHITATVVDSDFDIFTTHGVEWHPVGIHGCDGGQ